MYLLWAPLGEAHVRRFAAAYSAHDAGADHELVIAACTGPDDTPVDPLLDIVESFSPRIEVFEGPRIDLQTYREVVDRVDDAGVFLFMNSYCEPLADNWLKYIVDPLASDVVGMVGPAGTFESFTSKARKPFGIAYLAHYPRFPNPHIRTSCFALARASIEAVEWPRVVTKSQAWRLECGRKSLTRQLTRCGRRPLVVGRNGRAYEVDEWSESGTFRNDDQRNLLIADLRARDFENASTQEREYLTRITWGGPIEWRPSRGS